MSDDKASEGADEASKREDASVVTPLWTPNKIKKATVDWFKYIK